VQSDPIKVPALFHADVLYLSGRNEGGRLLITHGRAELWPRTYLLQQRNHALFLTPDRPAHVLVTRHMPLILTDTYLYFPDSPEPAIARLLLRRWPRLIPTLDMAGFEVRVHHSRFGGKLALMDDIRAHRASGDRWAGW